MSPVNDNDQSDSLVPTESVAQSSSYNKFHATGILVIGLFVGFVGGWFGHGLVPDNTTYSGSTANTESNDWTSTLATGSLSERTKAIREGIEQSRAEIHESLELDVAYRYGLATGGAMVLGLLFEYPEEECCDYISEFLRTSGTTITANTPAFEDTREHLLKAIKVTLTNIEVDCDDVINDW